MRRGFTTVELLVTLFIAALMVVSGYQLYSSVTQRGARVRNQAAASNIAYSVLRDNSDYVASTSNCTASPTSGNAGPSVEVPSSAGLPPRSGGVLARTFIYRCRPFSTEIPVVRVTARLLYDNPTKEVVHAIYVSP